MTKGIRSRRLWALLAMVGLAAAIAGGPRRQLHGGPVLVPLAVELQQGQRR